MYLKALVQHCLPLSFVNHVIPDPETFNGSKHVFVYVRPYLFQRLQRELAPDERIKYPNAWEYYFVGWGMVEIPSAKACRMILDSFQEDDWTFQGDDIRRPIPNLRYLFTEVNQRRDVE